MSITDIFKNYLSKAAKSTEAPEGFCPNCWGRQEYEGKFLEALHQEKIDLNNVEQKVGWIQAYAAEHFEGIKLLETDDLVECPSCKLTYRRT